MPLYTFSVFFTNRQTKLDPAQNSNGPPDCELELTRQGKRAALRCVAVVQSIAHCLL